MNYFPYGQPSSRPRQDMKDIVILDTPELIGVGFRFLYYGEFGPTTKCVVASWNGYKDSEPHNCRFVKDADGAPDYSQIVVPLDASRLPKQGRIKVKREFRVPDTDFEDGYNNIRIDDWVEEPDNDSTPIYSTIVINAMRGESADKTVVNKMEASVKILEQDLASQKSLNAQQQQDIDSQKALNAQQQEELDSQKALNAQQQQELDDIEPMDSTTINSFFQSL